MYPPTVFRLAMLDNGYWPLLNNCKRSIEPGWPKKRPSREEVLSWDGSLHESTGMKIDGDLAVIDADIREKAMIDALIDALDARYPDLFVHGLVRHASEVKQAWFVRTPKPFQKICSRKWTRGDPDDPKSETQHVECFSSRTTRQFGVHGPHSYDDRDRIVSVYQFVDGASPATIPRSKLPILPKAAFMAACNLFEEIAQDAGLSLIKRTKNGNGDGDRKRVVYDLTNDMVFENERDTYCGLEELTDACVAAEREGRNLRITSSFLGHGTNVTKCSVRYAKGGRYVYIHDFETELTHRPANRSPAARVEFLKLLLAHQSAPLLLGPGGEVLQVTKVLLIPEHECPVRRE